jgi:hypothetical protein
MVVFLGTGCFHYLHTWGLLVGRLEKATDLTTMVGSATETQQRTVSCPYSTHPSCIDDWRVLVDSWPSYNKQVTWRRRPALKFKIKCPITGTKVSQLLVIVLSSKSGRVSTTQGTSTGVKAGYTGWFRIRVNHGLTPIPCSFRS